MKKTTQIAYPVKPIMFPRADPDALAKFDPSTKRCTMNCGPHALDPRSNKERQFLCDECITITMPEPEKLMIEKINWVSIGDRLPDADIIVLIFCKSANEPCWPGYISENDVWFYVDGTPVNELPTFWAHMPGGPGAEPIYDY